MNGYVGVDGGYGKEPAFLRAVDRLGCRFVADVHSDQRIYLQDPEPRIPTGSGRGQPPRPLKAQTSAVRGISGRHHNRPMPGND